jgi:hypothetical protein
MGKVGEGKRLHESNVDARRRSIGRFSSAGWLIAFGSRFGLSLQLNQINLACKWRFEVPR